MQGHNGLEEEQYSRGFLVGGGSVKPRYGLFSVSNLRLYFCLPPRTRSRRTPVLEKHKWREEWIFPRLDPKGISNTSAILITSAFKPQHFVLHYV